MGSERTSTVEASTSHLTSLSLIFFICKVGILIILIILTLYDCCKDFKVPEAQPDR